MIKLENIEFLTFQERLKRFYPQATIREEIFLNNFIEQHQINNYQSLYDILLEYPDDKALLPLSIVLERVASAMNRANNTGKDVESYPTEGYSKTDIDDYTIFLTDSNVSGKKLIYNPPTYAESLKKEMISDKSVSQLKYLLQHTEPNGTCAFRRIYSRFSQNNTIQLQNAINFYEQQVIRQYEETHKTGVNLFTLNYEQKRPLAEEQLPEIISYLIDMRYEKLIWGDFSASQKSTILRAIKGENNPCKENFIDIIANYTTLSELEEGVVKTKVIDRFKSSTPKN